MNIKAGTVKMNIQKLILIIAILGLIRANAQPYPGGVFGGLSSWFKADNTTSLTLNGTNVSAWNSTSATYTVNQATASRQPAYITTPNTANNFNFNPSLQFNVASQKSLNNTSSTPDLLSTNGVAFMVVNTNNYNGNSSSCFAYYSNSSYRFQVKAHFRIQTGNNGMGYTSDFVPQFPTAYDDAAGRILTSSGTGSSFFAKRNGEQFAINNTAPLYFPAVSAGLCIGSNNNGGGGEYSNSAIAEVVTYNTQLSTADINKVESYLALKYGITLQSPAGPVNYVFANGGVVWDATANAGYNNNITGIGRDDGSGLMQKQSRSVNNRSLVMLYHEILPSNFPDMNADNTNGFPNNNMYYIIGDNDLDTSLSVCMLNGKMHRMARVWKVSRGFTNFSDTKIAVKANEVPADVKYIVVSATPNFTNPIIRPLLSASGRLYSTGNINDGMYFSFASDSVQASFALTQPTCANPASGAIAATVTGGVASQTYSWNTTPPQTGLIATGLSSGNYTFTVTSAAGCMATFNAGTIQPALGATLSVNASATNICRGSSTTLTATATGGSGNYTYQWLPGGQTTASISVMPTDTTKYYITLQDGNCGKTDSITIQVKPIPTVTFTALPSTICLGDTNTITYTGNAATNATYNWNGFAGATVLSGSNVGPYRIKFASGGTYTIQLQVTQNGCTSTTGSQQIAVQTPPTVSFAAAPAAICAGDTISVNVNTNAPSTANYTWDWGGGTVVTGTAQGPFTVKYNSTGTIRLTVVDGPCTVQATPKTISVTPRPVASFTLSDTTGCDNALISFNNTSQSATTWLWNLGDGTSSASAQPAPKLYTTGVYPVSLTATNGQCSSTSVVRTIRIVDGPTASFTAIPATGQPVQLSQANFRFTNTSTNASRYLWLFGDNNSSTTAAPTHTYNATGSYAVSLIAYNALGCTDTVQQAPFIVVADSLLRVPNAFSPNGDGINDTWVITGLRGYPTSQMNVFNRWGQLVFTSTGYNLPWDGTYKGKPLPIGTYYYTIIANNRSYTGPITLLR